MDAIVFIFQCVILNGDLYNQNISVPHHENIPLSVIYIRFQPIFVRFCYFLQPINSY
jgi:hypothetical protein